jgi:hypothetical protein
MLKRCLAEILVETLVVKFKANPFQFKAIWYKCWQNHEINHKLNKFWIAFKLVRTPLTHAKENTGHTNRIVECTLYFIPILTSAIPNAGLYNKSLLFLSHSNDPTTFWQNQPIQSMCISIHIERNLSFNSCPLAHFLKVRNHQKLGNNDNSFLT